MRAVSEVLLIASLVWSWSGILQSLGQEVLAPYVIHNDTLLYLQHVNFIFKNEITKSKQVIKFDLGGDVKVLPVASDSNITIDIKFPDKSNDSLHITDFSLGFTFTKKNGYWGLSKALMNVKTNYTGEPNLDLDYKDRKIISTMEMTAPLKMSFHCGRYGPLSPVVPNPRGKIDATASVELVNFQFQTFMKTNTKFDRSYDCVGFFTIGILSGWFMTILLLGILSWGIKMVMNVNTMDRFDDPKGKSITVTATD